MWTGSIVELVLVPTLVDVSLFGRFLGRVDLRSRIVDVGVDVVIADAVAVVPDCRDTRDVGSKSLPILARSCMFVVRIASITKDATAYRCPLRQLVARPII